MESTCAYQTADKEKKEEEMEAPSPVLGSGRKLQNAELKETTGHSNRSSANKFASQIKKALHRRSPPPLNWFPRKKTDSFLKRKIRLLQEGGGMSLSLVETLGNANPHYSRIAREKIAAQEAACKAMEARKTAMVEASWCRILQAARIQSKDAESKLEKAESCAAEAFEEAKLMGVMMFDRPDCPRRSCDVSSSSAAGGKSADTVTASFETEFEVDREVAAAVKKAFIILANCSSSSNNKEFSEKHKELSLLDCHQDNSSNSSVDLVNMMVDRLKDLREDELSSLATIVATCGLNAALLEMQSSHDHKNEHDDAGGRARRKSNVEQLAFPWKKKKEDVTSVPSLDKFLVKHVSRLQREVQQARTSKKEEDDVLAESDKRVSDDKPAQAASDLRSILKKHVSKLEREVQEAKNSQKQRPENDFYSNHEEKCMIKSSDDLEQPDVEFLEPISLASADVKEERWNLALELREITNGNISKSDCNEKMMCCDVRANLETHKPFSWNQSLDKILVKPVHWLEREKMEALEKGNVASAKKMDRQLENIEPLDVILVKHRSKLGRTNLAAVREGTEIVMQKKWQHVEKIESLDEILVKHQSKLERAKLGASRNSENSMKNVDACREARERELQEAWGGLSLGNSLRPHLSKLEKDKAAWRRAEQEAKIRRREC